MYPMKCAGIILSGAVLLLFFVGCGSREELGMKAEIRLGPAPTLPTEPLDEHVVGDFALALVGKEELALFVAALPESLPKGRMVFTRLVITNRRQDHPSRASVIIEADIYWQPAGDDPEGATLTLKTHSVSLEQPETQIPWLREQAAKGMWRRVFKTL
jgi:hypothetical protein